MKRILVSAALAAFIAGCGAPLGSLSVRPLSESPAQSSKITTKAKYTGPVRISIDPAIGRVRRSAKHSQRILSAQHLHPSTSVHGEGDLDKYFDPGNPSSFAGVDPGYGDEIVVASGEDEPIAISTTSINGSDQPIDYIGGQLIVKLSGDRETSLEKLSQAYDFRILQETEDILLIDIDLNTVSLSNLSSDLEALNQVNDESLQEIRFSSINGAKMSAVLADIVLHYGSYVEFAEWNMLSSASGWDADAAEPAQFQSPRGDWWLQATKAYGAWKYSIGTGVPLAVLDNGFDINNHPELNRRLKWQGAKKSWFSDDFAYGNVDFTRMDRSWLHGNMVTLVAAGERNNGIGLAGIAPNVDIWAANFDHNVFTAAQAIRHLADRGAKVINISHVFYTTWRLFGISGKTSSGSAIDAAIDYALSKYPDLVIVAGAGNFSVDIENSTPQYRSDVIVVGGLTHLPLSTGEDQYFRWVDSSTGENIDIWAPAIAMEVAPITSEAALRELSGEKDQRYSAGGTSSSGPVVAGAVALIKSRYPSIKTEQLIDIFQRTATATNDEPELKMINIEAAVKEALRLNGSLNSWQLSERVGILIKDNDNFAFYNDGKYYGLIDSVPTGTYDQFLTSPPSTSVDSSGHVYVKVAGWTLGGSKIEVHSLAYAPVPPLLPSENVNLKITSFSWRGASGDVVTDTAIGSDGRVDGLFSLDLDAYADVSVSSIAIFPLDEFGQKCCGFGWHTADSAYRFLAVEFEGSHVHSTFANTFGTLYPIVSPRFDLELNGNDASLFTPGRRYSVEVTLGDGTKIGKVTTI